MMFCFSDAVVTEYVGKLSFGQVTRTFLSPGCGLSGSALDGRLCSHLAVLTMLLDR